MRTGSTYNYRHVWTSNTAGIMSRVNESPRWRTRYAAVAVATIAVMLALYAFSNYFSA